MENSKVGFSTLEKSSFSNGVPQAKTRKTGSGADTVDVEGDDVATRKEGPPADAENAFDRDEARRRKREAVLRVAASAFSQRGFANTSMSDVARALRISKPTLYDYFSTKQDILYECHLLALGHGRAAVDLAASESTGRAKLDAFLRRYMNGIFGDFGNCPVLTDVDSLDSPQRDQIVARRSEMSEALREIIRVGVDDGTLLDCDVHLAAMFVLGAINWIPLWYRDTGRNTPDEIVEAFVAFFHQGFAALERAPFGEGKSKSE